jgi:hypothetical protein
MINIVVTSKPVDGLLHYSYEYCCLLNDNNIPARVVIIPRGNYKHANYIESLHKKYTYVKYVEDANYWPESDDISMILGRSMISIPYKEQNQYDIDTLLLLHQLFNNKLISVYSENDEDNYQPAIEYFKTKKTVDLCDTAVYTNGVGKHFEKTINFALYKDPIEDKQFEHLFLGTNREYYKDLEKIIDDFPDHGIITYNDKYINTELNNVFVPVDNLLGIFGTYIYTKSTFDPAPRIFMECKYYNKQVIYLRDKSIQDGGSVYWNREPKTPDIEPIIEACDELQRLG